MAESLKIEIDVSQAQQALDQLKSSFVEMAKAATSLGNTASKLTNFTSALATIKPIDSQAFTSVTNLADAISKLTLGNIGELARELNRLGRVDITKVTSNIKALGTALSELKPNTGLGEIAKAFQSLANAAASVNATASAVSRLQSAIDPTTKSVQQLAKALLDSAGFMSGLSVSIGNLLTPLMQLSRDGIGITQVLQSMTQQFGSLITSIAVLAALAIAFKTVGEAVASMVSSVIEVTQAYNSFVNVIDTIRGKGTGAEEFQQLRAVADATGQSIREMTGNYAQFSVAAQAAGLSSAKTLEIFKGFSTGLTVMGTSTQKAEKAWLALTQMMSKGNIQMEELRGQLGDAIPGAVQLFAQALGVSTKALEGMIKNGQVAAADVLPKVAELMNKRFEAGLATALEQATAQINIFNTAAFELIRNLGSGNFGGIALGFAKGLSQITDALKTEPIIQFAKVLGDILGAAINIVMSSFGGLINGFSSFFAVLGQGLNILTSILKPFQDWVASISGGISAMGVLSTAFDVLGKAIGFALAPLITLTAAVWTARAAMAAYAVVVGLLTPALNTLTFAATAAWAALGGPFVRVAIIGLTALALVVPPIVKHFQDAAGSVDLFDSKTTKMTPGAQAAANALSQLARGIKDAPNDIIAAGNSLFTFDAATKRAEESTEKLKNEVKTLTQEMKLNDQAFEKSQVHSKDYTDSIRSSNDAIQQQIEALRRQKQDMDAMAGAQKDAAGGADMTEMAIRRLQRSIEDNNHAIKQEELAIADAARRHKEFQIASQELIDKKKAAKAIFAEYKAELTATEVAEVKYLQTLGLSKTAATQQIVQVQQLTQTLKQQGDAALEVAAKNEELAKRSQADAQKIRDRITANEEYLKSLGKTKTEIDAVNAPLKAFAESLEKQGASAIKAAAEQKAYNLVLNSSLSPQEAVAKVAKELADKFGIDQPAAMKIAQQAMESFTKRQQQLANEGKTGWDTFKNTISEVAKAVAQAFTGSESDQIKKQGEEAKKTAEQLKTIVEPLNSVKSAVEQTNKKITEGNTAWANFTTSTQQTATNTTQVATAIQQLEARLAGLPSPLASTQTLLTPFITSMQQLREATTELPTAFTSIATAFSGFAANGPVTVATFQSLADIMPSFAETMPAVATGFGNVSTAFGTLSTTVQPVADAFITLNTAFSSMSGIIGGIVAQFNALVQATTTMEGLGTAIGDLNKQIDALSEAVKKAGTATDTLQQALRTVADNTDQAKTATQNLITEMRNAISAANDLATAYKKAAGELARLKALQSGGSSETSGGDTTASEQREGGMAGSTFRTQTVPVNAFTNAPGLAQGIDNTNKLMSKIAGGGKPTILHSNEAVIPLSKGRKVPVELSAANMSQLQPQSMASFDTSRMETVLMQVGRRMTDQLAAVNQNLDQSMQVNRTLKTAPQMQAPAIQVPTMEESAMQKQMRERMAQMTNDVMDRRVGNTVVEPVRESDEAQNGARNPARPSQIVFNMPMTVIAKDADSFKRTQDQLAKEQADKARRALARIA